MFFSFFLDNFTFFELESLNDCFKKNEINYFFENDIILSYQCNQLILNMSYFLAYYFENSNAMISDDLNWYSNYLNKIKKCFDDSCNHGNCVVNNNEIQCICYQGFIGKKCQFEKTSYDTLINYLDYVERNYDFKKFDFNTTQLLSNLAILNEILPDSLIDKYLTLTDREWENSFMEDITVKLFYFIFWLLTCNI